MCCTATAHNGTFEEGFHTTVLPHTAAMKAFQAHTATGKLNALMTPDEYLDQIAKDNAPIGRFASPEEIAHFVVFLCSPRASYCVGSTYYVDGGWLKVIT